MSEPIVRDTRMARRFLALSLMCIGTVIIKASTYPCGMREDLGPETTLAIGALILSAAFWILGFVAGESRKR